MPPCRSSGERAVYSSRKLFAQEHLERRTQPANRADRTQHDIRSDRRNRAEPQHTAERLAVGLRRGADLLELDEQALGPL